MQNSGLLRSTSVKLSLVYTGLIVSSFLLIGVVMWLVTRNVAEMEIRQDIQLEVQAIRTEFQQEGLDATVAAIDARAEQPGALEYWFEDADGRALAGHVPEMAPSS